MANLKITISQKLQDRTMWIEIIVGFLFSAVVSSIIAWFAHFTGYTPTEIINSIVLLILLFFMLFISFIYRGRIKDFFFPSKIISELKDITDNNSGLLKRYIEEGIRRNLLARFLRLDSVLPSPEKINIIFSHRGEEDQTDEKEYWGGKITRAHERHSNVYRSTSIPLTLEESSLIMQLWGTIYANTQLFNAGHFCSCEFPDPGNESDIPHLKENLILIGSNKTNSVTQAAFKAPGRKIFQFSKCKKGGEKICKNRQPRCDITTDPMLPILTRVDDSIYFCPTSGDDAGSEMVDYALISRIKNPWNTQENKYILILAGCRSAGALIIQFLLSNSNMLNYLIANENDFKEPFAIIAEVKYKRGDGLPDFVEDNGKVKVAIYGPTKFEVDKPNEYIEIDSTYIKDQLSQMKKTPGR